MYIPKSLIKEVEDSCDNNNGKMLSALSYFLYFKSQLSNSVLYNYYTDRTVAINKLKVNCDGVVIFDTRTVKKWISVFFEYGWVKKSGKHLFFVRLDTLHNTHGYDGKRIRRHQKRFLRIKTDKKFTVKYYKDFLRTLFAKSYVASVECQRAINMYSDSDEPSILKVARRAKDLRPVLRVGERNHIKISIFRLARIMKCSKSTAHRVLGYMDNCNVIEVFRGAYKKLGNISDLKREINSGDKKTGIFKHDGVVIKKVCNAYVF